MFTQTIRTIANAIDARDPYTRGHSQRVTEYSILIAQHMNLSEEEIKSIEYAGLLHDVGKIGIRDSVLLKPGALDDKEWKKMKEHPNLGADIIWPVKQLRKVVPSLKYHHERFAIKGYPEGILGNDIPLSARILAVADSFDAMTTDRPYRKGLSVEIAMKELVDKSGEQFDPEVVKTFVKIVNDGLAKKVIAIGRDN